jgi:hypothetical protein
MDITPHFPIQTFEQEVTLPPIYSDSNTGTSIAPDASQLPQRTTVANRTVTVSPGDDIQTAIKNLSNAGGGILSMNPGIYVLTTTINIPSNIKIAGAGSSLSVIDFSNTAAQFSVVGSSAYATGSVAISNDGTGVVGTGTTWTAAMIGQSILLEDFWYEITAVADGTHLTIGSAYLGTTLSGATYTIVTTVDSVTINGLTLQNSTAALLKARYVNVLNTDDIVYYNGLIGLDGDDSSFINIFNSACDSCGTGMTFNNFFFGTFFNNNVLNSTSGGGLICVNIRNWCIDVFSFQNNTGDALSFQDSSNNDVLDFSIQQTTGKGINFVSGNTDIGITSGVIKNSSSDAIKLTATTDQCSINGLQIHDNTGWGINIAASTCDNNIIGMNFLGTNTAGNVTDSGTGTKIRSNIGVADN